MAPAVSRTPRGCVDWNNAYLFIVEHFCVAPLVGAWIETKRVQSYWFYLDVAPLVGAWIETEMRDIQYQGLERRTPRGCVDWNFPSLTLINGRISRTPRGCVDWNRYTSFSLGMNSVAPLVGAWIETLGYRALATSWPFLIWQDLPRLL